MSRLRGSRVLVTGATGFIGGRLVEKLVLEHGASVRALVSSFSRCARIARFPVELVRAELLDAEGVERAAEGCDVIFHCAYGSRGGREERRRVTVEGTENVIAAAAATGARLVHVSSQMVYGVPADGDIVETRPRQRTGSTYGDSKVEAETRVLQATERGVPAVVLQPTAVYGPYAPVWTVGVLERMRAGRVPLIAGGEGICNAVYIDDVIDALILAASTESGLGECFLISAEQPITWREFYGSFEAMLGVPATVPVDGGEAATAETSRPRSLFRELPAAVLGDPDLRRRLGRTIEGRLLARFYRTLPFRAKPSTRTPELDQLKRLRSAPAEPPVHTIEASDAVFFASRARVRIDKARQLLGYRPAFGLREGMERTGAWARWAGLVPGEVQASPASTVVQGRGV